MNIQEELKKYPNTKSLEESNLNFKIIEDHYKVYENGLIIRFEDYFITGKDRTQYKRKKGIENLRRKSNSGYYYSRFLNRDYIHRIVAETFIDNPENKEYVNHIDGNKNNNNIDNLEWSTPSENMVHASISGLINKESESRNIEISKNQKESPTGLIHKELNSKKVAYFLAGEFIQVFKNITEASKILNIPYRRVRCCIKRGTPTKDHMLFKFI